MKKEKQKMPRWKKLIIIIFCAVLVSPFINVFNWIVFVYFSDLYEGSFFEYCDDLNCAKLQKIEGHPNKIDTWRYPYKKELMEERCDDCLFPNTISENNEFFYFAEEVAKGYKTEKKNRILLILFLE